MDFRNLACMKPLGILLVYLHGRNAAEGKGLKLSRHGSCVELKGDFNRP